MLEVFKPEVEGGDGKTATCWIPSEVGKKFEVNWTDIYGGVATTGDVAIDGAVKTKCVIHGHRKGATTSAEGVYVSQNEHKPFLFSALQVTEDESANIRISADLGTVSLTIWRVVITEVNKPFNPRAVQTDAHGPVHEKSKKGGSHVVAFGAAERSKSMITKCAVTPYSAADAITPWVKFVFRYRPLDLLQANEIAPRPNTYPTPARKVEGPVEITKIESGNSADEKIRGLEEKLNVLKSQKRKVEQDAGASKRVKSEEVEVIDLT